MDNDVSITTQGRVLALDLGTRRVGVALSDETRMIAMVWGKFQLKFDHDQKWLTELEKLVRDKEVVLIVVGLPLNMDGSEGPAASGARQWGKIIHEKTGVPVIYFDERLSTFDAENILIQAGVSRAKRKDIKDGLSAQRFLQSFLDSKSTGKTS